MNTIATFFAGIMAFISSLFGYHTLPQALISQPIVSQQETSTSLVQTQEIGKNDELITYRDEKFGLELKHPKNMYKNCCTGDSMIIGLGMNSPIDEERSINVFDISVRSEESLESWYTSWTKTQKAPPEFKDMIINNLPAKTMLSEIELNGKGTSCQLTGVLYQGKIFEICDGLKNEVTKNIINSIHFTSTKTEIPNSKVIIEKKFNNPEYIYTTKNGIVTYFIEPGEKDSSLSCIDLHYLDSKTEAFGVIKSGYCPRSQYSISPNFDIKKILPLHIQEGNFNFSNSYNDSNNLNGKSSDLYVLNLETKVRTLLYSHKNLNESLIAGCYYIPATYEFLGYLPYIEYQNNNLIKISVYKNMGQNSKPCVYDGKYGYDSLVKVEEYEKIREDIIDLTKIP